ncbi:hypothetical protein AYI69_g7042 [Smittium culicis]|uniref:Uncharacterized protein n=1 Tax=Smittium culicis TaxID=133412 RepID=A0A1R1XUW7_9FUNG|nr:hypothetical protein AYI69_g7042 [Smittium culicis]
MMYINAFERIHNPESDRERTKIIHAVSLVSVKIFSFVYSGRKESSFYDFSWMIKNSRLWIAGDLQLQEPPHH